MKDKIILITGSTSGIGLGIAKKFAVLNAKLIINGFGSETLVSSIINELKALGAKDVLYCNADLAKSEEISLMFKQILEYYGNIDVLVNNAGIQFVSPLETFPEEKIESIIRINLLSCFYTIKYAIETMKNNRFGRIINIASAHGLVASPFKSPYVAAKHGLVGLTKSVALELAEFNITVNAICPGYVKTDLVINQIASTSQTRGISEEEVIKKVILGAQATKKFVEINEIADLVIFLSGMQAASITGAALTIDGGWTAQ